MNVTIVLDAFPVYSETFIYNQIYFLLKRNNNVKLISIKKGTSFFHKKLLAEGIDKSVVYLRKGFGIYTLRNLITHPITFYRIFRAQKIRKSIFYLNNLDIFKSLDNNSITHTHFGHVGQLVCFLKEVNFLRKTSIVHSFHGFDLIPSEIFNYRNRYISLLRYSDIFTANSKYTFDLLSQVIPDQINKIVLLPVSLDTESFDGSLKSNSYGLKLIFIGRLVPWKGILLALEILENLIRKNFKISLDVIGDGIEMNSCLNFVNNNNLDGSVNFFGSLDQDEVQVLLSKADVLISPGITDPLSGRAENQGLVLQEAQAMEVPVIVSDAGGMKYGLIDGETGFVVPEGDVEAFVEKIIVLIENPDLRANMGKKGRKFVIKNFDYKILGEKLLSAYKSCL